jgi:membrane associated rhomboid family serine protease
MRSNGGREIRKFFFGGGMPATMFLLAANVVTFLITFLMMRGPRDPFSWLVFNTDTWPNMVWTIVTWPLVADMSPLGLIFGMLWMYWVGGSLERAWGLRTYLGFLAATAALSALSLWVGSRLLGTPVHVQGLWLATAPLTVAWCMINRREVIYFYGLIPVPAPLLAWLTVAMTFFSYSFGAHQPLFGLFALSGCAAAYWYVSGGRYTLSRMGTSTGSHPERMGGYGPRDRESVERTEGFSLMRWWRERQQRKRLEAMFRRSGFDDDQKKGR